MKGKIIKKKFQVFIFSRPSPFSVHGSSALLHPPVWNHATRYFLKPQCPCRLVTVQTRSQPSLPPSRLSHPFFSATGEGVVIFKTTCPCLSLHSFFYSTSSFSLDVLYFLSFICSLSLMFFSLHSLICSPTCVHPPPRSLASLLLL